jgi:hypothetical protein
MAVRPKLTGFSLPTFKRIQLGSSLMIRLRNQLGRLKRTGCGLWTSLNYT